MDGEKHASERDSLVMAASNPLDASHMVLVFAGNDPVSPGPRSAPTNARLEGLWPMRFC